MSHKSHDKAEPDQFCNAPFSQMLLAPTGRIYPCCYHFGLAIGHYQQSWQEIWNGATLRKLRREFLEGRIRSCRSRISNMACHKNFSHLDGLIEKSEFQSKSPFRLDIRLNGQCNLSCVMCDVWQQPNQLYDASFFWEQGPKEIFPYLKEIDVLGGEPFIQKDTYRLIRMIVREKWGIAFSFVTNANYPIIKKVLRHLEMIRVKALQVSLDAMSAATYFQVRKSTHYELVLDNIRQFAEFRQKRRSHQQDFIFKLSFCVLQQNWHEIPQFLDFCQQLEATPELQFAFYDPSGTSSLLKLSASALQDIHDTLLRQTRQADRIYLEAVLQPIRIKLLRSQQAESNSVRQHFPVSSS